MHRSSQQLLTSCTSELPEDHESSSVYLHLKRRIALTSSKRSQSRHGLLVPPSGFTKLLLRLSQVQRKGMGPTFLRKWSRFFFFKEPSADKNFEQGWVAGRWGVCVGGCEIKSLQVPGEQTQSAERAKERRRDKRFPFKLIPLRPSRFPSQDSQKSDKNLALWIWRGTGRGEAKKKDCFKGGWGETQKEQRGTVGGEELVEADQGRRGRQEGWAHSPRVHPCISLCQHRGRAGGGLCYQLSNLCYTSDDVLIQSTMGVSLFCPGLGSWDSGSFHAGLRSDSGRGRCRYPQHVGASKEQPLSEQPRDPAACQTHRRPAQSPTGAHKHSIKKVPCVWVLFDSMDLFYGASHFHLLSSKKDNPTTNSLLCCQTSWPKPHEKIIWKSYLFPVTFQNRAELLPWPKKLISSRFVDAVCQLIMY